MGRTALLVALLSAVCLQVHSADTTSTVRVLDTLTVMGTRSGASLGTVTRSVTSVGPDALAGAQSTSLPSLVDLAPAVDIRERGAGGVQADISIRGGSFEQTLILLDGIPLSDPQTGHHAFDIPVGPEDIGRIEVLAGQASRVYGPSAIGGVVNIVTSTPEGMRLGVFTDAGQNGELGVRATASLNTGRLMQAISASRAVSDGYRYNTDSDIQRATHRSATQLGSTRISTFAGYVDKDFGANKFYSDRYENQREHTTTLLLAASSRTQQGPLTLEPTVSWRRHHDDYLLDFANPSLYHNHTRTDVVQGGLQLNLRWKLGTFSVAGQGVSEWIQSSDLGEHQRYRGDIHAEAVVNLFDRLSIVPGAVVSYTTTLGWHVWPGADIGIRLTDWLRIRASADMSYRNPTFTEQYTSSPANLGDPGLEPEQAWSLESGLEFTPWRIRGSVSGFRRDTRDAIDWVRNTGSRRWVAANVDNVVASGMETSWGVTLPGLLSRRPFTPMGSYGLVDISRAVGKVEEHYLDQTLPAGANRDTVDLDLEYKYGTDYLRHKLTIGLDHSLPWSLRARWSGRYELRNGSTEGAVLLDGRLYLDMARFDAYVEGTNLLNTSYRDFGSIRGPGRVFRAGVGLTMAGGAR